jgi:hypothetical protein
MNQLMAACSSGAIPNSPAFWLPNETLEHPLTHTSAISRQMTLTEQIAQKGFMQADHTYTDYKGFLM